MIKTIFTSLIVCIVSACTNTYKLHADDIEWNPYKSGDILVFQSNQGDTDSILILEVRKGKSQIDPLSIVAKYRETLEVIVQSTNPFSVHGGVKKFENVFLGLTTSENGNTTVDFYLSAKDARFYSSKKRYYLDVLRQQKGITLHTTNNVYKDVIIIEPNDEYVDRDEFVTAIYWSKSKGYVRYDLKNGIYWELK